jgi:hypothetical protein
MRGAKLTDNDTPGAAGFVGAALLVCDDPAVIAQFHTALQQFGISLDICRKPDAAVGLLGTRKFEAIIVDFGLGEQAASVLHQVGSSPANRTAVTFALGGATGDAASVFKAGSRFVLQRPLSAESINRTLTAAFGLIVRERRRYFRYPVVLPASIQRRDAAPIPCQTANVSEGGMAITTQVTLPRGLEGIVRFKLPGRDLQFSAESRICWYNEQGQAGVQFLVLAADQKEQLQDWLSHRLEETLPPAVAERFRGAHGS